MPKKTCCQCYKKFEEEDMIGCGGCNFCCVECHKKQKATRRKNSSSTFELIIPLLPYNSYFFVDNSIYGTVYAHERHEDVWEQVDNINNPGVVIEHPESSTIDWEQVHWTKGAKKKDKEHKQFMESDNDKFDNPAWIKDIQFREQQNAQKEYEEQLVRQKAYEEEKNDSYIGNENQEEQQDSSNNEYEARIQQQNKDDCKVM